MTSKILSAIVFVVAAWLIYGVDGQAPVTPGSDLSQYCGQSVQTMIIAIAWATPATTYPDHYFLTSSQVEAYMTIWNNTQNPSCEFVYLAIYNSISINYLTPAAWCDYVVLSLTNTHDPTLNTLCQSYYTNYGVYTTMCSIYNSLIGGGNLNSNVTQYICPVAAPVAEPVAAPVAEPVAAPVSTDVSQYCGLSVQTQIIVMAWATPTFVYPNHYILSQFQIDYYTNMWNNYTMGNCGVVYGAIYSAIGITSLTAADWCDYIVSSLTNTHDPTIISGCEQYYSQNDPISAMCILYSSLTNGHYLNANITQRICPPPVAQPVASPVSQHVAEPVAAPISQPVAEPVAAPPTEPLVRTSFMVRYNPSCVDKCRSNPNNGSIYTAVIEITRLGNSITINITTIGVFRWLEYFLYVSPKDPSILYRCIKSPFDLPVKVYNLNNVNTFIYTASSPLPLYVVVYGRVQWRYNNSLMTDDMWEISSNKVDGTCKWHPSNPLYYLLI